MVSRFRNDAGSIIVEFALSVSVFCVALIAVVEFSRLMYAWGSAAEGTRRAARLATTCSISAQTEAAIRARVRPFVVSSGQVDLGTRTDWLVISYLPAGCTSETCTVVEARLNAVQPKLAIPFVSGSVTLPPFPVRLPREAMRTSTSDGANPACA